MGLLTLEGSRAKAREAVKNGFTVLKTKAGRYWKIDVERIEAMHDELNGALVFRLNLNQRWRVDEIIGVGAMLKDAGIYTQYIE